ncbi:MAG: ABC transporter ATP-binding protein [Burkholderiaceae bacterium]|nr:ABC transporter ATP-binding protein [Burkholderiaceae bacterium]
MLLEVDSLDAFYGDFQALFGISVEVDEGSTVAIVGANSAGKSTLLLSIAGLLANRPDSIALHGAPVGAVPAHDMVRRGVALVPEGRRLFPSLSVEENLLVGGYSRRPGPWNLQRVYRVFPDLQQHRRDPATRLSGGQQQMVAIGRALMANPVLLMCDEISLGLAPVVIRMLYESLPSIAAEGTSVLVVEQDIRQAMKVADQVYCLQEGRVSLQGSPAALTLEQMSLAYFGS